MGINLSHIISNVLEEMKIKLNEGSRDKYLDDYVKILNERGIDIDNSQLKRVLLAKFVNEASMNNLSLESNYYLAGVAKYYFEGKLTTNKRLNIFYPKIKDKFIPEVCTRLNALIMVLRNSFIDSVGASFELPEQDFGGKDLDKLLRTYNKAINKELGIDTPSKTKENEPKIDTNDKVGNKYTFDILYSYEDARKYYQYTSPGAWCITYGEHHYNTYIKWLHIHYVIFKRNGYENVERKKGKNWTSDKPQDEYGNSLIALLQSNTDGEPVYITSRWNHGTYEDGSSCEADHAYTKEEFMAITGVSDDDLQRIFKIWKMNAPKRSSNVDRSALAKERIKVMRIFKYAQIRMNGGNISNAFGEYRAEICNYLSNVGKIKSLNDKKFEYPGDAPEIEKITKSINKIVNSSIRGYRVLIDDTWYNCLVDGTKILFDTITKEEYRNRQFCSSEDASNAYYDLDASNYNNVILCKKGNYVLIYDTRKHDFVRIDGDIKFKAVPRIYSGEYTDCGGNGFYEVKMSSTQMALVDMKTNIPLVLPNGRSWFECLNTRSWYSREIRANTFTCAKHSVARIVYDSSADEVYWFDMITKKFFDPNHYFPSATISIYEEVPKAGLTVINLRYDNKNMRAILKGAELFEIDGYTEFSNITVPAKSSDAILYSTPDDIGVFIHFISDNNTYVIPYEKAGFSPEDTYLSDSSSKFLAFSEGWQTRKYIVFSIQDKEWKTNPIDGRLVFYFRRFFASSGEGYLYDHTKIGENARITDCPLVQIMFDESTMEFVIKNENDNENTIYENMNRKRIILTRQQLNEILIKENENVSIVNAVAQQNNLKSAIQSTNTYKDIKNVSNLGTDVDVRVTPESGPSDTTIMLDNPQQTMSGAVDAINKNPEAEKAISRGINVQIPVKNTNESKSFSKRQIEEARLRKMREEGVVMKKRDLQESFNSDSLHEEKKKNKIEIDPENKGKFNATKKRTGKSTEELKHSKNPKTRKRAIFAQNAEKWNKGKKHK